MQIQVSCISFSESAAVSYRNNKHILCWLYYSFNLTIMTLYCYTSVCKFQDNNKVVKPKAHRQLCIAVLPCNMFMCNVSFLVRYYNYYSL